MKKYKEFLIKLKIYKESPISAQKVLSLWIIFKNPNSLWMTLVCTFTGRIYFDGFGEMGKIPVQYQKTRLF